MSKNIHLGKDSIQKINTLVVALYVIVWSIYHIFNIESIYNFGHILPVSIIFFLIYYENTGYLHITNYQLVSGFILSILFVFFSLNLIFYGHFYYLGFIPVISYLLAMGLLRSDITSTFWDICGIVFSLFVLYSLYIVNENANEVLIVGSRNVITSILFFFACMSWIFNEIYAEKQNYLTTLNTLFVSYILIMATGRSGIVVALGLIFILLFSKKEKDKLPNLFFLSTSLVLFISSVAIFYKKLNSINYLIENGLQSKRWEIWHSLLVEIELKHILIGFTPEWGIEAMMGLASHNSFIRVLRVYGIVGPVLLVIGFLFIAQKNLEKYNIIVILSIILAFRVFFDQHLMMPFLGIAFWVMLLHNR